MPSRLRSARRTLILAAAPVSTYAADTDAVRLATPRIAGLAHHTPVMIRAAMDAIAGRRLYFKCEQP